MLFAPANFKAKNIIGKKEEKGEKRGKVLHGAKNHCFYYPHTSYCRRLSPHKTSAEKIFSH